MASANESLACISCFRNDYDTAFTRFSEAENNYSKVRNGKLSVEVSFYSKFDQSTNLLV